MVVPQCCILSLSPSCFTHIHTHRFVKCRSPALGLKEATGECSTKHRSVFQQHEAQTQPHSPPCTLEVLVQRVAVGLEEVRDGLLRRAHQHTVAQIEHVLAARRSVQKLWGRSWAGGGAVQAGWECVQCRRVRRSQQQQGRLCVDPSVEWCSAVEEGVHHCVREGGL